MNPALRYTAEVKWSDEDECFVASVPALGAKGHGHSPGEAVDQAFVGAEGILDVLKADGKPIPPER
jgi:predicted RNase H-like HicB family nuclease